MDKAEQRDLIARYVAAYNRFDVDGTRALVSGDVLFENKSGGGVTAAVAASCWPVLRRPRLKASLQQ